MCLNSSRLLKSLWTPGIGIQTHWFGQLPWIRSWRNCNAAGKPSKTFSRDAPCRVHEKGGKNNSSRLGDTTLVESARAELSILLGLMLGISLPMALPHYEHRNQLVVDEAGALITVQERAELLPEPFRGEILSSFAK